MSDFIAPLAPDSGKLLLNLRNLGYSSVEAIADIIDNSVDAGASTIRVHVKPNINGQKVNIEIVDDGRGMSPEELLSAMSLVSHAARDYGALGKFGIGLKSAGLYLANSVTVISKPSFGDSPTALRWFYYPNDGAYRLTDNLTPEGESLQSIFSPSNFDLKTAVLLEGLIEQHLEGLEPAQASAKIAADLDRELSLIFGKLLRNEKRKLSILINGHELEGIDPLETRESRLLPNEIVRLPDPSIPPIRVACAFTTSEELVRPSHGRFERSLPDGLYVYRNERLMHAGQWFGMKPVRHSSNVRSTRIVISTVPDHDDFFAPSIAKNKVMLPKALKKHISGLPAKIQRLLAPKKRAAEPAPEQVDELRTIQIEDFDSPPIRRILTTLEDQLTPELFEELLSVLASEIRG